MEDKELESIKQADDWERIVNIAVKQESVRIIARLEGMKQEQELPEYLAMIHTKDGNTDCCYCPLCHMSEMEIQDNGSEIGEYYCLCSVWDSSYEGKWLRWRVNIENAKKIMERNFPNGYNQALSDAIDAIQQDQREEDEN